MNEPFFNPFRVTRAADLKDEQINEYWVDLTDGSGFIELIQPRLEMPMLILGGKGSGKTHLMRYLSFPLQKIRHSADLAGGIRKDGYLGIYLRCSGLNSSRFRGKRQSDDAWADVFAYYIELWLGQLVVETCREVVPEDSRSASILEPRIAVKVKDLFDKPSDEFPTTLAGLITHFRMLQKQLDVAINNCALDGSLDVTIRATSGRLIFGIPRILTEYIPELRDILFVYLIDEFENLTEPQQKLLNTLIREKEAPCSFKIGARLYGMRTYSTYCAEEDIKEGSEFECLQLDTRLRADERRYATFARRLVVRRLTICGILASPPETDTAIREFLSKAFDTVSTHGLAQEATDIVKQKYVGRERPYFRSLRQVLKKGLNANAISGVSSPHHIDELIRLLSCTDFPLLEKLNCFILYQKWSANKNLVEAAEAISEDCRNYLESQDTTMPYHSKLLHWKYDLLAQLRRDCDLKQQYSGFETLLELSWGNPRHLLILLKHILSWALFKNETPFDGIPVSIKAQVEGVRDAAEWFFRDARMTGRDGQLIQNAIGRLGTLFRGIRFANKPSECSISTFSYEPAAVTTDTRRLIDLAEKWLLLVYVGGQRDRNSDRIDMKCQLNRLLAPRWDISSSRRGALAISGEELNSIFDPDFTDEFNQRLKIRIDRMTAPFFGAKPGRRRKSHDDQKLLYGDLQ